MAAISHVFTIRRAAQILGRDEDLLWELSDPRAPEDGKLCVYDIDALKPPPSPTMASRRFAKLSRIRSIAPVNLKTSVPRCSAYAYVQSVCRCVAFWAIAGLLESKRPPTWGPVGLQRRRSKSSARDDDGRTSAILLCSSEKLQCHQLQPEVAVKLKILKSRRNASLFGICAVP